MPGCATPLRESTPPLANEEATILLLDTYGRVRHQLSYDGIIDMVHLPLREIVMHALNMDCVGIVLMHTHPSGNAQPSAADVEVTRSFHGILKGLDIKLLDHVIIARDNTFSFREQGLL